jgi:4-amino-4-deoxy-L-arabinose transferase-like glycosyltransferase
VIPTNPAIVAQAAARRLPRVALLLFCLAYLLPGFIGRDAWKSADASGLGFMTELAQGTAQWLHPSLIGMPAENPSLLPYWLGAWALQWAPAWIAPDFAARIPFVVLLALCMAGTWFGTYYLARSPKAQPVAFAFGGEASPKDYARAMADGGLLALIACLGLAQLSHETTPAVAQTAFTAMVFYAVSAMPYRPLLGALGFSLGLAGLSLSGAPVMALLYGVGGLCIHWFDSHTEVQNARTARNKSLTSYAIVFAIFVAAALAYMLDLWRWKVEFPQATYKHWRGFAELLLWFTWPAWPLALWTVWRWRKQILSRHISRHLAVPLWFVGVTLLGTVTSNASDRALMLTLPPLAALAAFALPTLKRQVASLIDWFTLLFFTTCAISVWVVWIAMLSGYPSQPAANVARLAPGFEAHFSFVAFGVAMAATLVWGWLVKWRVGRHRTAIWKSLVLPAGGAALCWLLLMTLWMPLLNYAQSYNAMVERAIEKMTPPGCVEAMGLSEGKIAALQFYGKLEMRYALDKPRCPWLIAEPGDNFSAPQALDEKQWILLSPIRHPTDGNESVLVFRRR